MTVSKKVQLRDVCVGKSSNIALNKIKELDGNYPLYGASGFIQNVGFYNQEKDYIGIVKDGAGVGRVVVLPPKSSILGTMQYILPKDNISIRYLFYQLCNLRLVRYASGATIPHIYFKDYSKEIIHLPSLQEQKEIALKLDKASELIALRKKQLDELDNLAESVFYDMFGNPVKNEKGWILEIGEKYCKKISVGVVIKPASYYEKSGIIALRSLNIKPNKIILDDVVYFSETSHYETLSKSILNEGDVVVVRTGSTGTAAVIPKELDNCNCIDLIITRPNTSKINPIYLAYIFNTHSIQQLVTSKEVGGIQKHFNVGTIKAMQIPIPPLALQNKFATIVEKIEEQRSEIKKALLESEDLFQKLMQDLLNPD